MHQLKDEMLQQQIVQQRMIQAQQMMQAQHMAAAQHHFFAQQQQGGVAVAVPVMPGPLPPLPPGQIFGYGYDEHRGSSQRPLNPMGHHGQVPFHIQEMDPRLQPGSQGNEQHHHHHNFGESLQGMGAHHMAQVMAAEPPAPVSTVEIEELEDEPLKEDCVAPQKATASLLEEGEELHEAGDDDETTDDETESDVEMLEREPAAQEEQIICDQCRRVFKAKSSRDGHLAHCRPNASLRTFLEPRKKRGRPRKFPSAVESGNATCLGVEGVDGFAAATLLCNPDLAAKLVAVVAPHIRVPLWNTGTSQKLAGLDAPRASELQAFMASKPEYELYLAQGMPPAVHAKATTKLNRLIREGYAPLNQFPGKPKVKPVQAGTWPPRAAASSTAGRAGQPKARRRDSGPERVAVTASRPFTHVFLHERLQRATKKEEAGISAQEGLEPPPAAAAAAAAEQPVCGACIGKHVKHTCPAYTKSWLGDEHPAETAEAAIKDDMAQYSADELQPVYGDCTLNLVVQVNALVEYYKTFARRIDVHEPWQRGEGLAGAKSKGDKLEQSLLFWLHFIGMQEEYVTDLAKDVAMHVERAWNSTEGVAPRVKVRRGACC